MKKLNTKAGFTLAELLIVVAIIAILVAIGIPVFSTAMERSRETVDLANIRAAYAEFMSGNLSNNGVKGGVYKIDFKQTNGKGWLIETGGLKSLLQADTEATATAAAVYALDTPAVAGSTNNAVKFELDGTSGKPKLSFCAFTAPADETKIVLSDTPDLAADGKMQYNVDGTAKYKFDANNTTYYLYKA